MSSARAVAGSRTTAAAGGAASASSSKQREQAAPATIAPAGGGYHGVLSAASASWPPISTWRRPTWSGWLTWPSASMRSIRRAALL